jgi:hypothetical protein
LWKVCPDFLPRLILISLCLPPKHHQLSFKLLIYPIQHIIPNFIYHSHLTSSPLTPLPQPTSPPHNSSPLHTLPNTLTPLYPQSSTTHPLTTPQTTTLNYTTQITPSTKNTHTNPIFTYHTNHPSPPPQ